MRSRGFVFTIVAVAVAASPVWADVWINEFHYLNSGGDVGEFVEIAGPAGTDLTGWTVYAYNGSNGKTYDSISLSGTIPGQQNGYGTLDFAFGGLQNGDPDGLALIDAGSGVVQFLSYGGTFTAADGPAAGELLIDIGVKETRNTPVGYSLQLGGSGDTYGEFTWQDPLDDTPGAVNTNQTFDPTVIELVAFSATGYGNNVAVRWETATEIETAGFHIWRTDGEESEFQRITTTLIPAEGGSTWGAAYVHIDEDVIANAPYVYMLEDIEYSGKSTLHDPSAADWNSMLVSDVAEFSASTGGTVRFALDGGGFNRDRNYGLFGSMSGTVPGTLLPGSLIVAPLNLDLFTRFLYRNSRAPWCNGFFGTLDGNGIAKASLDVPASPVLAGWTFHFSFVLDDPWDVASNAAELRLAP